MHFQMYDEATNVQHKNDEEQVGDVLTDPMSRVKFEYFRDKLGLVWKDLSQT